MQLSKLEIKGFKSFGDKVTVNFDEGITGIVGPNGCGKSNIVDAIRWVLGEQKTTALRSDKMENVIFNGTKNRKALQMAEVSLTFNNTKNLLPTEYSHVTITRRYYRSGESEYQLNGVTCRLKDITNLFLDTGIGSDSYAIIELKMVDNILNDKDNSRRTLFEEAAGISKFKIRKKQTLKKLEETDKDLERVEDLLFEITKNLKGLEKQAKQTEKYFQIKEEYKQSSITFAKLTVSKQAEAFEVLNKKIEQASDHKTQLSTSITEKETESEKLKASFIGQEKLLSSRQKTLNEHVNKIRQYESERKIKNERLRFLNDKNNSLSDQIDQDKKNNERAEFSINSLHSEKENSIKILDEKSAKLSTYKNAFEEQKLKNANLQQELSIVNNKYKLKQQEVYQHQKNLEIFNIQLSSLKQELEKTSSDDSITTASLEQFETKLNEVSNILENKTKEYDLHIQKEEELQQKIELLQKDIEQIKEKLTQTNRKLDAKQNEFNLTKSLVDNLEGFPEAIKFLKKNSSWGKDTPLLSDILTCDEKYRLAIENFLEPFMNYYVVDNEAQAIQAVNLLSDAAKGKANFFILATFENYLPAEFTTYDNCIPAITIAEYDPKYKNLIAFILDHVYIITSKQDEIPNNSSNIFITQNGKITKRRYSISGGSVGLFEGKRIGRAKNLEKLQVEIKKLNEDLDEIKIGLERKQKDLFRFKESTFKNDIENLRKEINTISQEHISVKTKKEQFASMLEGNALRKEDIQEKIEKILNDIEIGTPLVEDHKIELENLEDSVQGLNEELVKQGSELTIKSSVFNQENILYHQQENKVKSLEQEIGYKQASFDTSKERIQKNIDDLKKTSEEIKALLEKSDTNEDELLAFYKEKENIESGVTETEKDYYRYRARIDEIEKEVREIRKLKEEADVSIQHVQHLINENKLGLSAVKERLSVEFSVNLDEVSLEELVTDTTVSEDELKQKVSSLKSSLDKLGPINPLAMEAYNEIQERNAFITGQKDDLVKAKASLLQTIGEIDVVAKVTFMEAYEKIRENFITVFRSLFTEEDTCDLKLSEPNNPLDSSIEILARPKGKKPLTINQLSGGEKTLTAISLLFAIYLIKPAPFCIFDEVDAPLDDANIDKFNNIIKKFSKDSQFIIVTHNKRTMSSTDVIYGITMIEQGVSRLVPVDLRSLA